MTQLYWLESRADQGGRSSLWRRPVAGGDADELTPAPVNVRTRVHEYGGGEYDVRDGVVVFSDFADGRLYRLRRRRRAAESRSPRPADLRYADLRVHPDRDLVLAVREDHSRRRASRSTPSSPSTWTGDNDDGGRSSARGADFYSTPELSARRAAGLGAVEPPEHAVGLHRDHGRHARRRRGPATTVPRSPARSGRVGGPAALAR